MKINDAWLLLEIGDAAIPSYRVWLLCLHPTAWINTAT